ncbi:MAG: hypothetical protein WAS73_05945 [Defluviicoccus sp.]
MRIRHLLGTPEVIARTWAEAEDETETPEHEVIQVVSDFAPLSDELAA